MHLGDDAQSDLSQKKHSHNRLLRPALAGALVCSIVAFVALIACGNDSAKKARGGDKGTDTKTQTGTSTGGGSAGEGDAGKGDSGKGGGKGDGKADGEESDEGDDDDDGGKSNGSKGKNPKGSGSTGAGGFLKANDFVEEKSVLTKAEVQNILMNEVSLALENLDASKLNGDDSGSDDDCSKNIDKKLQITPQKIALDVSNVACETDKLKINFRIKSNISCEKKAFDKIDAAKIRTQTLLDRCVDSKMTQFSNMQIKMESKEVSGTLSEAVMTAAGGACTFTIKKSTVEIQDGCVFYRMGNQKIAGKTQKFTVKAQYKSVSGSIKKPLYSSGTLDVSINGWKGTIKLSGSDPTYNLTSAKGEKISGKWSDLKSQ